MLYPMVALLAAVSAVVYHSGFDFISPLIGNPQIGLLIPIGLLALLVRMLFVE